MSQFTGYQQSQYLYQRDGKEYTIPSPLLNSLFKNHGYCVDPGANRGTILSQQSIEQLQKLALTNNDQTLLTTIRNVSNGKVPSPRMNNDGVMHETTFNEKRRYEQLSTDNKESMISMLYIILNVGLYLSGWKGEEEPYITSPKLVSDKVRMELKIIPLIQSLHNDSHYALVKNFPIMGYYRVESSYVLRPSIIDHSVNVEYCLNSISLGVNKDYETMGSYLILTAYYYITTVCNMSLPMLEPLILSLTSSLT